jgi:hypothetical protein
VEAVPVEVRNKSSQNLTVTVRRDLNIFRIEILLILMRAGLGIHLPEIIAVDRLNPG